MNAEFHPTKINNSISIRIRLVSGFGVIIVMTLGLITLNYLTYQQAGARMQVQVEQANRVSDYSQNVQYNFLQARQYEANLTQEWRLRTQYQSENTVLQANQKHINQARQSLGELNTMILDNANQLTTPVQDAVNRLGPLLLDYQATFVHTSELIRQRSLTDGLEKTRANLLRNLKGAVLASGDMLLGELLLRIYENEQNYRLTGRQEYIDNLRLTVGKIDKYLQENFASVNQLQYFDELNRFSHAYLKTILQIVEMDQEIQISMAVFNEITSDIEAQTTILDQESYKSLVLAQQQLRRTNTNNLIISTIGNILLVGIGALIAINLTRRITRPLNLLTNASHQISQGNWNALVPEEGGDEFTLLSRAFNRMVTEIKDLVNSLENRVFERTQALEASYEVSRRLAHILDERTLVAEVVNQLVETFKYYHAHIYLFDADQEYLVMVGGTGEAGKIMLSRGHKLSRGKGLVGRAADENSHVLVADVTRDSSWIANPLLPETRSELAVPITIDEQVLGVLDVQQNSIRGFKQQDVDLLQSIASQLGVALKNARAYASAQDKAKREAQISAIAQKIQSAKTIQDALKIAARELGRAVNAPLVLVRLRNPSQPSGD